MNTITPETELRLPVLEWSVRKNAGRLEGLGWVDSALDPKLPPFYVSSAEDTESFRHAQYLAYVPNLIAWKATQAQHRGEVTAWEGLQLLFAQPHWAVAAREYLWTPHSPYPALLSSLVERFGVDASLHRHNATRLGRLTALLPARLHTRGSLPVAKEILTACEAEKEFEGVYGAKSGAPPALLQNEIFACRDAAWWRARNTANTKAVCQIRDGFLRFQDSENPTPLRTEDFLLTLNEKRRLPKNLFRLLPVWAVFRLTSQPKVNK